MYIKQSIGITTLIVYADQLAKYFIIEPPVYSIKTTNNSQWVTTYKSNCSKLTIKTLGQF